MLKSLKKNCVIRVEGNKKIGFGHVKRCIALTEILCPFINITIVSFHLSKEIKAEFSKYKVSFLTPKKNLLTVKSECEFIMKTVPNLSLVIFDGYIFNEKYKKPFFTKKIRVISIDDSIKSCRYTNVVLNHAPLMKISNTKQISVTKYLLGSHYLLISSIFYRNLKLGFNSEQIKNNLFISLGSSVYAENRISVLLKSIINLPSINKIFVITNNKKKVQRLEVVLRNSEKIKIFSDITSKKMFDIMNISKIGICSSSTVALESCAMKLPLIVGYTAKNQLNIYKGLVKSKMAKGIGKINDQSIKKIAPLIKKLLENPIIINSQIIAQDKYIKFRFRQLIKSLIV